MRRLLCSCTVFHAHDRLYHRLCVEKQSCLSGKDHSIVQTVTLTLATQRRAVLEAIAFGTFVRDTEIYVDGDFGLLTSNSDSGPGMLSA